MMLGQNLLLEATLWLGRMLCEVGKASRCAPAEGLLLSLEPMEEVLVSSVEKPGTLQGVLLPHSPHSSSHCMLRVEANFCRLCIHSTVGLERTLKTICHGLGAPQLRLPRAPSMASDTPRNGTPTALSPPRREFPPTM